MPEAAPGHIGDVKQAIHAIEIDERAEIGEVLDRAVDPVADLHAFEEFLALLAALLLDQFAAAEDDVLSVVVDLDDLEIVGVADELLQILRRNDVDLRGRQKCFDADVHHQAAFDDGLHLAFDQAVACKDGWRSCSNSAGKRPSPWRGRPCPRRFRGARGALRLRRPLPESRCRQIPARE